MRPTDTPASMDKHHTALPTGTVTFLFTDIQGSVPLWEYEPEKMAEALQIHNAALRRAIEANGGIVFKTVGDAFQAAFPTAPQALKAAIEGQRALRGASWNELGELKVRMGLHTGEAALDPGGDEYAVSHTKNRIGRIHSTACGGQIVLSQETADLVVRTLPEGVSLKDLDEHRLKGMEWPEHLYQVYAPGLPSSFPPLATAITHPVHNLPLQLTSFIGREKEIAAVTSLLHSTRLVTLTGPGGTGKTRLTLETAVRLVEQFTDGVWLVELAPLTDPALVPTLAARALGLREQSGSQMMTLLQDYLEQKQLLLILDNCEHVIEACIRLADILLQACPKLTILTSSREALGIAGEVSFRVPPLTFPKAGVVPPLEALAQSEAVRLFVERAATASPGFSLTPDHAPAILQICQRLDGIPLAIELAAARTRLLQVEEIAGRLDDRFRLLTGGSRAALPRYQTLRASIDWSYDLLSEAERALLQRLSVFAGGWVLEAAESVGCGEGIQSCDVLELLGMLVDKSLVQVSSEVNGLSWFRLLETIREYALERLTENGELESLRHQHACYFVGLAEKAELGLRGPEQRAWIERLEVEHDNFRAALEWSILHESPEMTLMFGGTLGIFWSRRGYLREGYIWLKRLLERAKDASPGLRAKAMAPAGYLAFLQGEFDQARLFDEESLELFRLSGDKLGMVDALNQRGTLALFQNDSPCASTCFSESLAICEELGYQWGRAYPIVFQAQVALFMNQWDQQAKARVEESLEIFRELDDKTRQAHIHILLGLGAHYEGDNDRARAHLDQAVRLSREAGDKSILCASTVIKSWIVRLQGYLEQSITVAKEGLGLAFELDDKMYVAFGMQYLAGMARDQGHVERTARLFGAAEAVRESIGFRLAPAVEESIEPDIEAARLALGEDKFARVWAEGRAMTMKQAVEYAKGLFPPE